MQNIVLLTEKMRNAKFNQKKLAFYYNKKWVHLSCNK